MSIEHRQEPEGNALRAAYTGVTGRGQMTYTPTQLVVARAKGCWLQTVDGRKLLDFASGVLVANLGHAHPAFEKRLRRYARHLPRNAYNLITPVQVLAAQRIIASMRAPFAEMILWAASGSEGIQKAMWCAMKRAPDRPILLATRGGFHGKKGLAGDVTGESSRNPDVRFLSFPRDEGHGEHYYAAELDALWQEHEGRIALLITEPYLGAAGSWHPPAWYHPLLERWCRKHGVTLIWDEVQSCFGRTGAMYAFQKYGVEPDLVVLGKGMANGEAAAAVVGRAELINALDYGEASDTFSAQPAACAAVCAALDVFEEQGIVVKARVAGERVAALLRALQERFPFIRALRGEGMVFGLEMESPAIAERCILEAYRATRKRGVHLLGPLAQKVIRVSPPLTLDAEETDRAGELLAKAWGRI